LCNTTRFPDWPVKAPVELLKDVLDAWKLEVDRKPESLSFDEACDFFFFLTQRACFFFCRKAANFNLVSLFSDTKHWVLKPALSMN
jgi:hypothetical protein